MARRKVHSTGGFWLVLGALLMAASLRLLFWFLVACLVHELGHWGAIRALGGRVGEFRLTGVGAVIFPARARMFSYWEECLVALAGPAASLLLALAAGSWGRWLGSEDAYLLTGVSLVLGLFNLLPADPLDGSRAFRAVFAQLAGPDWGDRLEGGLTRVLGGLLLGVGLWVLSKTGNFMLVLCGGWLLCREIKGTERGGAG